MTKHKYVSCAAAGAVYSLAFFYGYLFVFAFIGLSAYFAVVLEKVGPSFEAKKVFRKTLCFSLGFYIPLYSWFYVLYPFEAFGFSMAEGIFIVIAADVGLGVFHSLINSASFCLLYLFPKKTCLIPLGAGCCMMVSEFVMSNLGFLSFPWGTAAVGLYRFLPLIQNVSLFGTFVIPLIVGAFCASVAVALRDRTKANAVEAFSMILLPLVVGSLLLVFPSSGESAGLKVACVQGNIPSMEKWDSGRLGNVIDTYVSLAEEAASDGADLVVLPESAIPTRLTGSILKNFTDIAEKYETDIIVSGIIVEDGKKYNSILLINSDGTLYGERYDKQHLVPFGEYLPFGDVLTKLLPFVSGLNLSSSPFTAGSESKLLYMSDGGQSICISPLICFDSIFPSLARSGAANGADFLVISTNDSWYKDSPGVYQHEAQSVLRAVENGKWAVRCANTGVSCFVSPKGKISGVLAPMTKGITTQTITFTTSGTTLYTKLGNVILIIPAALLIYSVWSAVRKKKVFKKQS